MTRRRLIELVRDRVQRNGKREPLTEERRGDAGKNGQAPGELPGAGEKKSSQAPAELGILLSNVQAQRVEWLWLGRIPLGKLTILDGDPGLGKSVLTLDLAARVSRGMPMPDGEPGEDREPAGVVLLSAEDGLEDTIVPRLDAAGADRSRILALDAVPGENGPRPPVLPFDAHWLRGAVQRMKATLVVIDPLTAYLAAEVNAHRDTDVRRALFPLAQLAENTGAAVIVIRHLNKGNASNPLYRGGGSIGIIGAARSGLLVAKDPDNPDRRVLASTKCNLAKLPTALAFALDTGPNGVLRIGWTGPSAHTAESLLALPRDDEERDAVAEAVDVLRSILIGRRKASDAKREGRAAGVSERSLLRAKKILGVRTERVGFGPDGEWFWSIRAPEQGIATP